MSTTDTNMALLRTRLESKFDPSTVFYVVDTHLQLASIFASTPSIHCVVFDEASLVIVAERDAFEDIRDKFGDTGHLVVW